MAAKGPSGATESKVQVVAGGDNCVVNGRIETSTRLLARCKRQLRDAQKVGAGLDLAHMVEPRQVRVLAKAREDRLEPVELRLRPLERFVCAVSRVDEELDARAHGAECPVLHHDVRVTVSGGSDTIRTEGAVAAATWAWCAAAIWTRRWRSCTR